MGFPDPFRTVTRYGVYEFSDLLRSFETRREAENFIASGHPWNVAGWALTVRPIVVATHFPEALEVQHG